MNGGLGHEASNLAQWLGLGDVRIRSWCIDANGEQSLGWVCGCYLEHARMHVCGTHLVREN